jgi:crossover junction endodeoxyribonuclease RuvC
VREKIPLRMSQNPPDSRINPLIVLGIDPGYDRIGWAIGQLTGNAVTVHACGCIETTRSLAIHERYREIDQQLDALLTLHTPAEVVIESLFFFRNKTTVMAVSEARGVMISRILQHNLPIFEYTPLQIKETVTGYGRAEKAAVLKMVLAQTNLSKITTQLDDTIDAVAAIITHASRRKLAIQTKR